METEFSMKLKLNSVFSHVGKMYKIAIENVGKMYKISRKHCGKAESVAY